MERLLCLLLAVFLCELAAAQPNSVQQIRIGKFRGLNIAAGQVDQILATASRYLQIRDDIGDPQYSDEECPVTIRRFPAGAGAIEDYLLQQGVVTDRESLERITLQPDFYVKIVSSINWCGTEPRSTDFRWGGCTSGKSFVVTISGALDLDSAVFSHEYGHTQTLLHPPKQHRGLLLIMNPEVTAANRSLLQGQCAPLRAPHSPGGPPVQMPLLAPPVRRK